MKDGYMESKSHSLHLVAEDQRAFVAQLIDEAPTQEIVANAAFFTAFRDNTKEIIAQLVPPQSNGERVVLDDYREDVSVLVYYPKNNAKKAQYSCLYYIHGGGHISGFAAMYDATLQNKADTLDVIVVAIDYRLSPEHPYPSSLLDSFAGFEWVIKNSSTLNINPNKVSIMGESAGGGLTAALNLYIRDQSAYKVKSQILIYPMLDCETSYQAKNLANVYCGEFIWTHPLNKIAWKALLGNHDLTQDADQGYYSPALAKNLKNLPETYIVVGSLDLFFSESLVYADRLVKSGVSVKLEVIAGAIHLFDLIESETADHFNQQLNITLKKLVD